MDVNIETQDNRARESAGFESNILSVKRDMSPVQVSKRSEAELQIRLLEEFPFSDYVYCSRRRSSVTQRSIPMLSNLSRKFKPNGTSLVIKFDSWEFVTGAYACPSPSTPNLIVMV